MASSSARLGFFKRFGTGVFGVLVLFHAGLIVAYFVTRWLGGASVWFVDAAAYVLPWLFVPSLLLLPVGLLLCRSRVLTVVALVPPVFFLSTCGHLFLPRWPVRTVSPAFTVLTHNVLYTNEDAEALVASVEAHEPDFFGLRELGASMAETLEPRFAEHYPHHQVEPGCGFWSRYPILAYEASHLAEGEGAWTQQFVLDIEGHELTVLSVHPRSPPVYGVPLSEVWGRLPTALDDRGRDADLRGLLLRLEGIAGPLVVIGDCNATDQQSLYAPLVRRLRDAHRESGWGMGFTYSRWPDVGLALWRIDYVFYTPELAALSTRVGDYAGSDHRPVIARLAFRAGE
ncbi:MAG: endonuclease/exonuclease/phosphatase family protein [Anaerolineae bacterium]|nr:endonuclease/exonuclease/phosphatase family protein [Anaerolineae bacterium]